MRTTVDIDNSVLEQLKKLQQRRNTTLGALVSELLARAMAEDESESEPFVWVTSTMGARIDLEDRDAILDLMDDDG